MGVKHQYFDLPIPRGMPDDVRYEFEQDVIEFMKRRTEKGLDVDGHAFPGYSDSYINSLDFKNAGKHPGRVNLTLTGDMLASVDILERKATSSRIGFEKGSDENAKADGNIRGMYGGSKPNPNKKREFLGISDKDYRRIARKYAEYF